MNEERNNIIGSIFFFLLIIVLAVGGFFVTKKLTKDENKEETKNNEVVISDEYKVDKEKEYIYFENEKFISMEPDITYKDVIINLNTAETVNRTLKNELDSIRNSVKYITDNPLDPNREVMYDGENIYSASERNYEIFEYKEYISLIVRDYEFSCYDGSLLKSLKSYVYNISNGKMLLTEDLLGLYNISMETVKEKIREHLQSKQTIIEETQTELILIDETINNLNNPSSHAIYIDKYGDLNISFIVKSSQVDYNESIKLN